MIIKHQRWIQTRVSNRRG